MNNYEKPIVFIDSGMAEGIYTASGVSYGVTVNYEAVLAQSPSRGNGRVDISWSGINGIIEITLNFNANIAEVSISNTNVEYAIEGKRVSLRFSSSISSSLYINVTIDNATHVSELRLTGHSHNIIE